MWKTSHCITGHRDDYCNDLANKGNLMAMLSLLAENDKILRKYRLKICQNNSKSNYLDDRGFYLWQKFACVNDSVFSLIADEVTDISNNEILSLCLRYESMSPKIQIKEIFIDFVQLDGITGELIANAILHTLRNHRIDVTKCRGQWYDGATAMSYENVGVQIRIRDMVQRRYIHIAIVMCWTWVYQQHARCHLWEIWLTMWLK